jgi:hypothetical protein
MRPALCTGLVLATLLAACGGSVHDGDRMVRTGTLPVRVGGGKLVAQPSPLTLADLRRHPAGLPQAQVMRTLFFAQWGGLGAVADAYTPAVRAALGDGLIGAAYQYNRLGLSTALPRVKSVRVNGNTAAVTITFFTHEHPPQAQSYVLHRIAGSWRIGYDSSLARTIGPVIVTDPHGGSPEVRNQRAQAAVGRYRRATQVTRSGR